MSQNAGNSILLTGEDLKGIGVELGIVYTDMRTPVVMLDCPDQETESSLIRLLEATQDGQRTFTRGLPTYFGDQRIQVMLSPGTSDDVILVELYPLASPGHLTVPFILRDLASRESLNTFRDIFAVAGHYHLITGRLGKPSLKKMSLVKYTVGGLNKI